MLQPGAALVSYTLSCDACLCVLALARSWRDKSLACAVVARQSGSADRAYRHDHMTMARPARHRHELLVVIQVGHEDKQTGDRGGMELGHRNRQAGDPGHQGSGSSTLARSPTAMC